jgi:hypothetical protein
MHNRKMLVGHSRLWIPFLRVAATDPKTPVSSSSLFRESPLNAAKGRQRKKGRTVQQTLLSSSKIRKQNVASYKIVIYSAVIKYSLHNSD